MPFTISSFGDVQVPKLPPPLAENPKSNEAKEVARLYRELSRPPPASVRFGKPPTTCRIGSVPLRAHMALSSTAAWPARGTSGLRRSSLPN